MVATLSRMASDSYYLEAQKTYRPHESAVAGPGLLAGTDDGGAPGAGSASGVTDYYDSGEEPDGVWWNPNGLFGLEDGGIVGSQDFRRLYHGFDPETMDKLTQNAGDDGRSPGLDMTFSADKSVSALWAIADEDLRAEIARAHNDACRVALDGVIRKHCSYTRRRVGGGDIELVHGDVLGAMFQHGTSREGDPQLHTHCLVFNVTLADDGKHRSHYQPAVFRWKKAAGATYRHALAWHLQERLGISMERYGRDGEFTRIIGMPEDLLAEWSKRRRTIEGMADTMGFDTGANAAAAAAVNKATRKAKEAEQGGDLRHVGWDLEAAAYIENRQEFARNLTGQEVTVEAETLREAMERLDRIPGDVTEHEAVFRLPDVVERAMNATAGVMSPPGGETAVERVLRNAELVELDRPGETVETAAGMAHTRVFSTRDEIAKEVAVGEMAVLAAADRSAALPSSDVELEISRLRAEGYPLSDEQVAAIRYGAGAASGRLAIIEGAAGSGKTTTLRPITDLYQSHGYTVIATAVAWRTAVALGTDCAVQPYSVDKLLRLASRRKLKLDAGTVIVVDEAGMLSTKQAYHLLRLAEGNGCKIIAAGDTQQHQPIGAGPGLRLMREAASGVRVDEIRRQKADLEDILVHVHGALPATARLRAELMGDAERKRILAGYEAMEEKPDFVPWQIATSAAFKDGRAVEAIQALRERGRFFAGRDLETTLTKLVDDWADWRARNPEGVATVIARTHDEIRVLSHLMRERSLAPYGDDERVVVQACRARADDARTAPLEIARGDLLRIGALVWEKKLYNGTVVEVRDFTVHDQGEDGERVEIFGKTEYGDAVSFFVDEVTDFYGRVRLDHGYAMTIASAQGRTVDAAFVLADDRAARQAIYPAATRHREHLSLYVNRAPVSATIESLRSEDQRDAPVTDDDIVQFLGDRWSREGAKVAAHDYMSEGLRAERRTSRSTDAGGKGGDKWVAANDNGSGALTKVAFAMRAFADRCRHGSRVQAYGARMKEVDAELDALGARLAETGRPAELLPEYRAHLDRHRDLAAQMMPLARNTRRHRHLWQESAGVAVAQVVEFQERWAPLAEWVGELERSVGKQGNTASRKEDVTSGESVNVEMAGRDPSAPAAGVVTLMAGSCALHRQDPKYWSGERIDSLRDLHARAVEALAHWPAEVTQAWCRREVEGFARDFRAAEAAWKRSASLVGAAEACLEARAAGKADRADEAAVIASLDMIEADTGSVWHAQTLRSVFGAMEERELEACREAAESGRSEEEAVNAYLGRVRSVLSTPVQQATRAGATEAAQGPSPASGEAPNTRPRPATDAAPPDRPRGRPVRRTGQRAGRPSLPGPREIRDRLAERAEEVCREYLPLGKRNGHYWSIGNVEGDPGRSMYVHLTGTDRGHWKDGATGEHGDLLDVIRRSRGLPDLGEAMKEARAFLGDAAFPVTVGRGRPSSPATVPEPRGPTKEQLDSKVWAERAWKAGRDMRRWDSTPASRYLLRRGLDQSLCEGLRWHPRARTRENGELVEFPALLAKFETHDGAFEGIQRVFLTNEGEKAPIDSAKKHLGHLQQGGVWFGNRAAPRIAMTEGVEDALAAIQALPPGSLENLAVVATVGGGRMHRVELPPTARELVVLQDNNAPGERAWKDVEERYGASGVAVKRIVPNKDVNDDLVADRSALEHLLRPLVSPLMFDEAAAHTGPEAKDLERRVAAWREKAAKGGWAAAEFQDLLEDLAAAQNVLSRTPAAQAGEAVYGALREFAAEAGRAREAMRIAPGFADAMEDLWRERRGALEEIMSAPNQADAARQFFANPPSAFVAWTERAGRAQTAIQTLREAAGTPWENAVMSTVGRRVVEAGARPPASGWHPEETSRGRHYVIRAERQIDDAVKGDDRMRTTVTEDAVQPWRVGVGHGISYR